MKTLWKLKRRRKTPKVDTKLSDHEKARLEFQRSFCSVRDRDRRRARNAALRRSKQKQTGGRRTIEGRPHPDRDKAIGESLLHHFEKIISGGSAADPLGSALLAFADCMEGFDRCRHRWCSKCEMRRVSESGQRFKCVSREVDRMFIRAATILLNPIPIHASTDAASVAAVVRSAARSLCEAVLASGIRMGHLLLPDFRLVHRYQIESDDHAHDFFASHDPNWRWHETWLIPHLHGLIFFWEWSRHQEGEALLDQLFPGNRSVMLRSWYANQTDEEASMRWGRYCGEQEVRLGAAGRSGSDRLSDLYTAPHIWLIEEIHRLIGDEPELVHWADSDDLGLMSDEPVHVELHEVWGDLRSDEQVLYEEWNAEDVESDLEAMRADDDDRGSIEFDWAVSRGASGGERPSVDVHGWVWVKSSHYRPSKCWQGKPVGVRSRGPPCERAARGQEATE